MLLQTVKVCGLAIILTVGIVGSLVVAQQEPTLRKGEPTGSPAPGGGRQIEENGQRAEIPIAARTAKIVQILDQHFDLELPPEASLSDYLKAIKKATTNPSYSGIPIYVDPVGLQETKVSLQQDIDWYKSGPLGHALRQSLRPWHLSYLVKDGFLMISSRDEINDERLERLDRKFDRLLEAMERLERSSGGAPPRGPRP